MNIEYLISLYKSKFFGYQSKKEYNGKIKLFISNIYEKYPIFNNFVSECIFIINLERICLERCFQKIRLKERCKPFIFKNKQYYCKIDFICYNMFKMLKDD